MVLQYRDKFLLAKVKAAVSTDAMVPCDYFVATCCLRQSPLPWLRILN